MFIYTEGILEKSEAALNELVNIQEEMFSELGLHFKIYDMATEELGSSAYKKFDFEAWMPFRNDYGEISSASNCTDFQSARLNAQYFDKNLEKKLVHTINGKLVY